jgi:predicted NBD/HSP70 family sugar kinase
MDLTIGPEQVMPTVTRTLGRMLTELGRSQADLRSFGCSIPGTVDTVRGAVHESPLMGRWDSIPLAPYLQELAAVPVAVENDVFVLALSERSAHLRRHDDLIAVKASTGLGVGVVTGGQILRGSRGGAGELGHVRSPSAGQQQCRCGEIGCLETVAAGWALVQLMNENGYQLAHVRDLVALVLSGDALARSVVREAGRRVGEVLATAVCLLNPSAVVIGGDMAPAYDTFAAGLRETLYANATAFSTKELVILEASHRELAGLVGSGQLAVEHILSPVQVDRALASSLA